MVTRTGDSGNNRLVGTSGDDWLYGRGGRDTLYGYGGDDNFVGGQGADTLYGGDGNDDFEGGAGYGNLSGDGGDTIYGGNGDDYLRGGSGNDLLYGGADSDIFLWTGGDTYWHNFGFGQDIVRDFQAGVDTIAIQFYSDDAEVSEVYNDEIDSNGNGRLDGADEFVDLKSTTVNGVTRNSLVIDCDAVLADQNDNYNWHFGGPQSMTLFGVLILSLGDMM